ncbi:hypothetical protein [Mycobacteroides abscessus]|uniref:hypothetical protein n=1 Tax=Mycobacteroides abscessus TaxID=36809 RepID=UPI0010514370|nr:hypothetical protein [Mycobacteroides abscessus]
MAAAPASTNAAGWLRENGFKLSREHAVRFADTFNDLVERYADPAEYPMRDAAMMAAARYLANELSVEEAGVALDKARARTDVAMAVARIVTLLALEDDSISEHGAQRAARVDRMTVRRWRGKR